LAYLIADHIAFLLPTGDGFVLSLGKKKLGIGGLGIALVSGNQFAAVRIFWIFSVIRSFGQTLNYRFAAIDLCMEIMRVVTIRLILLIIYKIGDANAPPEFLSYGVTGYLKLETCSKKFQLLGNAIFCTCLVVLFRKFRAQV